MTTADIMTSSHHTLEETVQLYCIQMDRRYPSPVEMEAAVTSLRHTAQVTPYAAQDLVPLWGMAHGHGFNLTQLAYLASASGLGPGQLAHLFYRLEELKRTP